MLGMITYLGLSMFAWLTITCVRLWILGFTPFANSIFILEGEIKYLIWLGGKMMEIAAPFWIVWVIATAIVLTNLKTDQK